MQMLKMKNACTSVTGFSFLVLKFGRFEITFLTMAQYFPAE
jgi:hypothetical protein